ncbi:hypothetical protein ACWD8I_24900, partial [Micromonospora arida]
MDEFADDHQSSEVEPINEGTGERTQQGRREVPDKEQKRDRQPFTRRLGDVLEVRDGGPGFTDDDLAVAFERG